MQIDQTILDNFNTSKEIKISKENEILNILLKGIEYDNNLKYIFKFPESKYGNLSITFKDDNDKDVFTFKFKIESTNSFKYDYSFASLFGRDYERKDILLVENAFSMINAILNNFEQANSQTKLNVLYKEYYTIHSDYEKKLKELEKNEEAFNDYQHGLTFNKIKTVFKKDPNIVESMYEDLIHTYYTDTVKNFITVERDFDKIRFKLVKAEAKYKSRLSLLYKHGRTSKNDLKDSLEKDVYLFNGKLVYSTSELVDILGIDDILTKSSRHDGVLSSWGVEVPIEKLYNHFRKHIVANEF